MKYHYHLLISATQYCEFMKLLQPLHAPFINLHSHLLIPSTCLHMEYSTQTNSLLAFSKHALRFESSSVASSRVGGSAKPAEAWDPECCQHPRSNNAISSFGFVSKKRVIPPNLLRNLASTALPSAPVSFDISSMIPYASYSSYDSLAVLHF